MVRAMRIPANAGRRVILAALLAAILVQLVVVASYLWRLKAGKWTVAGESGASGHREPVAQGPIDGARNHARVPAEVEKNSEGERVVGEMAAKIELLERELDRCKSSAGFELLMRREVRGLVQISASDYLGRFQGREQLDLVRRIAEGYETLRPSLNLAYWAEKPLMHLPIDPESKVAAFLLWLEGLVGDLAEPTRAAVSAVFREYIEIYALSYSELVGHRDARFQDLYFQRQYAVRNRKVAALLEDVQRARFIAFVALHTRLDLAWIQEYRVELMETERPIAAEDGELLEWLAAVEAEEL